MNHHRIDAAVDAMFPPPEPSVAIRALAATMRVANSAPCSRWYALKDRFCERFGTRDGYDLQRLKCWGYYSRQLGGFAGCIGPDCQKCGGTGVHRTTYLRRYRIGSRIFHRPITNWLGVSTSDEAPRNIITGYCGTKHGTSATLRLTARLVLAVLALDPSWSGFAAELWRHQTRGIRYRYRAVVATLNALRPDPSLDSNDIPF